MTDHHPPGSVDQPSEKLPGFLEQLEEADVDEFEVTVVMDENGEPDHFHITSISPRVRK